MWTVCSPRLWKINIICQFCIVNPYMEIPGLKGNKSLWKIVFFCGKSAVIWLDLSSRYLQVPQRKYKCFPVCVRLIVMTQVTCYPTALAYLIELWADILARTLVSLSIFTLHPEPLRNRWLRCSFYKNPQEVVTTLAYKTQHRLD